MLKFPRTPAVAVAAEKEAKNVVAKKAEDTVEEINHPIKVVEKKEATVKKEARKSRDFIS